MDEKQSLRSLGLDTGPYQSTTKSSPSAGNKTRSCASSSHRPILGQPGVASSSPKHIPQANIAFRPRPARDEARPSILHHRRPEVRTNTINEGASTPQIPTMPAAMRWAHPNRGHTYNSSHSGPGYRGRDTIPPILISGTNEIVITPPEESWHAPRVLRPVEREMFSSQTAGGQTFAPENTIKTSVSAGAGKATSSTVRKSRPYEWTKTHSSAELLLLADMIEMKHIKNTDRKRLERVLEGALGTMLEMSTEPEKSTVLPDLEEVPRTYSSLVRAAIKLQIIVPSRFLILGQVDQTDNLMRACREFILFLKKRSEDTRAKKSIIKIEDEVIELSSDNAPETPTRKKKRKRVKYASRAGQETMLERPKKRKREGADEEAAVLREEQMAKKSVSTDEDSAPGHVGRRISDQGLLQKHLQDTEEENGQLRALLEAHGVGRSGVTMGLLRIKNGHIAESALRGLWEARKEMQIS